MEARGKKEILGVELKEEGHPFNPLLYENEAESKIIVLLDKISKMINAEIWKRIKGYNISLTQAQIITHLLFAPNDKKNISFIADSVGVSKPTISRAVDNLIDKGIIEKSINPDNRRSHILNLTQKGIQIALNIFEFSSQMRDSLLDAGIEEKKSFLNSLFWFISKAVERKVFRPIASCIFCKNMVKSEENIWCEKLNLFLTFETIKIDCPYFQSRFISDKAKLRRKEKK
jgi:DNA-binding MarR family transcriptional regulator